MKLKFTGPKVIIRTVESVEWSSENNFIAEAPVGMAADLLTQPESEFLIQEANQEEMEELAIQTGVDVKALEKYMAAGMVIEPIEPIEPIKPIKPTRKRKKKEI